MSSHLQLLNYLLLDCTYFSFPFPLLLITVHIYPYLTLDNYYFQIFHVHGQWHLLQPTVAQIFYAFFSSDLVIFVTTLIIKLFWLWLWPCGPGYFDSLRQKQHTRGIQHLLRIHRVFSFQMPSDFTVIADYFQLYVLLYILYSTCIVRL